VVLVPRAFCHTRKVGASYLLVAVCHESHHTGYHLPNLLDLPFLPLHSPTHFSSPLIFALASPASPLSSSFSRPPFFAICWKPVTRAGVENALYDPEVCICVCVDVTRRDAYCMHFSDLYLCVRARLCRCRCFSYRLRVPVVYVNVSSGTLFFWHKMRVSILIPLCIDDWYIHFFSLIISTRDCASRIIGWLWLIGSITGLFCRIWSLL